MDSHVQESKLRSARVSTLDVLTLCAFLIGAFSTIWLPNRIEPQILFGATLIMMAWSAWANQAKPKLTDQNWQTPWIQMTALTLLAGGVLYLVCRTTGAFHGHKLFEIFDKPGGHWLTIKLPTVLGQQIMLQLLLMPVLFRLFEKTRTVVFVGALIFASLHLPNPVLVLLTFVAGSVWIFVYSQSRQLTPIVASHFVLAIMAAGLCGEYVLNMRVGPSCLAMFPTHVRTSADPKLEFPNCIVGSVERLVQRGDQLIMVGWVRDPIHGTAPTALYSAGGQKLKEITQIAFERAPASDWQNAVTAGFVGETCYSFVARLPASRANSIEGIRLMAANANGHLGRVGQMGEIKSLPDAPKDQSILLFPVEVDGRINKVIQRTGEIHFRGWAADLHHVALINSLKLDLAGQLLTIDLQSIRHQRADLVAALNEPAFNQCGFDIHIDPRAGLDLKKIRCFAVDQNDLLHPVHFTDHAQANLAAIIDLTNEQSVWR